MMLTGIAEYFLEHSKEEIQWGRLFQPQTLSISDRFAKICNKKGGWYCALGIDDDKSIALFRDTLQHYVFRHAKRGEGPAIYLCLTKGEGTLKPAKCSSSSHLLV